VNSSNTYVTFMLLLLGPIIIIIITTRPPSLALEWTPEYGRRRVGRPKRTWQLDKIQHTLKEVLEEMGVDWSDARERLPAIAPDGDNTSHARCCLCWVQEELSLSNIAVTVAYMLMWLSDVDRQSRGWRRSAVPTRTHLPRLWRLQPNNSRSNVRRRPTRENDIAMKRSLGRPGCRANSAGEIAVTAGLGAGIALPTVSCRRRRLRRRPGLKLVTAMTKNTG